MALEKDPVIQLLTSYLLSSTPGMILVSFDYDIDTQVNAITAAAFLYGLISLKYPYVAAGGFLNLAVLVSSINTENPSHPAHPFTP